MRRGRAIGCSLLAGAVLLHAALCIAQEAPEAPAKLPFRTDGTGESWRTGFSGIFITLLLLGAVAAGLWFWRQRLRLQSGVSTGQAAVRVEWARRVSPRTTLMLVRWRGKEYLLAENTTVTQVLDSHAAEEPRT